jgi:3,4-dihydroxy 2-butanone 4-phosphate synthase/GTP cyclohydrolase II
MEATLKALDQAQMAHPSSREQPFVCVSYAQSIDGAITRQRGQPYPISSKASLALTHALRANHEAILVGIGTLLADDPQLNVRLAEGPDPQPVIVDSRLRTPLQARVMQGLKKAWIATLQNSTPDPSILETKGVKVLQYPPDPDGRVPLNDLLRELRQNGVHTLIVEGGGAIITSFLELGLVDWIIVTIAPLYLGGYNLMAAAKEYTSMQPIRLKEGGVEQIGDDIIIWGSPKWEGE